MAQETSSVHLFPHGSGAIGFVSSMEVRLAALEERLRQTEEVLVEERLARQTEAAQQAMRSSVLTGERVLTVQSLVDTKAIGRPPTFSGDIDTSGQLEGMPWSQWSFVFRSYHGAYDSVATRLLQQVEAKVEDPSVVDNESVTEAERRLSVQLFYVLALTCKGKSLQVVRRVPEGLDSRPGNSFAESSNLVFLHDSKVCCKLSCRRRELTIQCRPYTSGRAGSKSRRSSLGMKCRRTSSWQSCRSIYVTESLLAT